jgi:two-component system, cell cycle sensor histidine kinase and response regulator CckA
MGTPLRALIVEDSPDDIELLLIHLRRSGYDVSYQTVDDPAAMGKALAEQPWDIILCDHAMPHFSSDLALAMVKEKHLDIPFIIVSGAIGEEHAVNAMRSGCHDYVMKSNLARLVPAIQREMRDAHVRSERRLAENALRDSEARFLQVIDSLSIVFFSIEADTNRVLLIMGPVHEVFGYDRAAFTATPDLLWTITHPDDADHVREAYAAGVASLKPFDLEYRIMHGQHHRAAWIYQRVVPIPDAAGNAIRHDSVVMDIAEQKQAEEEREKMQAQLFHAQKLESIGVLAGGIAHDFNNLLTIISGNAQYLSKTLPLDAEQAAVIKDIETAAANAAEMTRSLQAFSRPAKPQIRYADANKLVQDVYRLLRRMIPTTIDFQLELDESPCTIAVDTAQLQQVLVNLCVNARDAMPTGGLLTIQTGHVNRDSLPTAPRKISSSDTYVRIAVTDSGSGMDTDTLRQAFDPFFTTKPLDRGTGLGLTIVYKIVMAHDGVIHVNSEPGHGAVFEVFFPAADVAPADETSMQMPPAQGQERILVVEHEEMVASLIRTILESRGYHVTLTHDPHRAIEICRSNRVPFDLAIVGYGLPHMTGDRCLASLQQATPDLKGILTTGYDINEADLAGMDCQILYKPFSMPAIARMVRDVLDGAPGESEVGDSSEEDGAE